MSWEMVNINEICRPRQWKTLSMDKLKSNGYAVYGANGKIGFYSEFTHEHPTLAITCRGATCGTVHITEPKSYINGNAMALDNISESIDIKFLYYYFLQRGFNDVISGSAQPQITGEGLSKILIPLPPLATQKRIAEILDAADALKPKDQQLLKKYDELAQAIFIDMFGDIMINDRGFEVVKFGDVCEELFLGLTSKVDYVIQGGIPLIRATDINKGILSFENVKFISLEQHRKLTARRITKRGDVLISKSGTLGTCAIVESDVEFSTYESIFTVRPKKDLLNNVFLVSLIRNPSFQEKLIGGKVGAGVAHLNLNMLRDFKFPIPTIELQKKYAENFLSIKNQIDNTNSTSHLSSNLFQTLIQKAFNGELVN